MIRSAVVLSVLAASGPWSAAIGATLTGVVKDQGRNAPNGIAGVTVQVRLANGKYHSVKTITDTDGEFALTDAPDEDCTIVLDKVGYVPRPDDSTSVKKGQVKVGEIMLVRAYADAAYYDSLARRIAMNAQMGDKEGVYLVEWIRLQTINLPPSSRAMVATKLKELDEKVVKYVPHMKAYLEDKPADIRKVEQRFDMARNGKASIPSQLEVALMNVSEQIVADIMITQISDESVPEAQRSALKKEFQGRWDGTNAVTLFNQHLDRPPPQANK
jgi:hypothetical protein